MYCLEVIKAMNAAIPETASRPTEPGWTVKGENGIATIFKPKGEKVAEVDVSDPLEDSELVQFHLGWQGPEYVAAAVERYGSQWRRIIITTPAWAKCLRRRDERVKNEQAKNALSARVEGEHTVGLIIPRQVASPQSLLPLHQAKGGYTER